MADPRGVKHLVVDSGAFIRNAPVREIGENVYTITEVVDEIKDKATRQRLQVLPYELQFRQPPVEAIQKVTEFSKKTGDYPSLSAVDLRLLALAYQLEKEHVGEEHIKTKPEKQASWTSTRQHLEKPTDIAGFYLCKKNYLESSHTSESQTSDSSTQAVVDLMKDTNLHESESPTEKGPKSSDSEHDEELVPKEQLVHVKVVDKEGKTPEAPNESLSESSNPVINESRVAQDGDTIPIENLEDDEEGEEESDENDDDDDEGWITPNNIEEVKQSMGDLNMEKALVDVGCITTDFAMQNVLIQMGLNVVSVDGMLIRRAKSYVLRCSACLKVTTTMMVAFCPHCGNSTLQKISMTVDDDGNVKYYLSRRKPPSTRGLKYSLPAPRGGKHAVNPILVADQPEPQQRGARASKVKYDVFDPDYVANSSPFAPVDLHSRAGQLGIRNKRNHNIGRKKSGRKK